MSAKTVSDIERGGVLILGIGNTLMGDEGIGVHIVNDLKKTELPETISCLDGGTGSFNLLEPLQSNERIILVDATLDGAPVGTVRRLQPRFSSDYPPTLTAHDIGLKDLLDSLYLLGTVPKITLYTISIASCQKVGVSLSPALRAAVPEIAAMVHNEALELSALPV